MKAIHQDVPPAKRILEVNPNHALIEVMRELQEKDADSPRLADYTELLYDQALLTAQLPVEDPLHFTRRVSELMAEHGKRMLGGEAKNDGE